MRGDRNDGEPQQGFAGERPAGTCGGAFPGTQLEERGRSSRSSLCSINMKTGAGWVCQTRGGWGFLRADVLIQCILSARVKLNLSIDKNKIVVIN